MEDRLTSQEEQKGKHVGKVSLSTANCTREGIRVLCVNAPGSLPGKILLLVIITDSNYSFAAICCQSGKIQLFATPLAMSFPRVSDPWGPEWKFTDGWMRGFEKKNHILWRQPLARGAPARMSHKEGSRPLQVRMLMAEESPCTWSPILLIRASSSLSIGPVFRTVRPAAISSSLFGPQIATCTAGFERTNR